MRTYVHLYFRGEDLPDGPEKFLQVAGIRENEAEIRRFTILRRANVTVTVDLPEDDERIPKLLELLKQHGEEPLKGGFDVYTDEELDNARLLALRPVYQCEVDGGSEFGTTYDLTGTCPSCAAGARQTSALFLDGAEDELPKLEGHRAAGTYRDEIFVDDRIAADIENLGATGLVLHQVYAVMPDTQRQTKLAYKQLSSDRILPPMAPPMGLGRGGAAPCNLCTRSSYQMGSCLRIFYRRKDLEGAGDVNLSWEGLHNGEVNEDPRKCVIPVPVILVTPKVMRVFRAAGITEFEWVPIRVVDE